MGFFGSEVTVLSYSVELTDAQIKALPSGDFTIIPAAGEGKLIVLVAASLVLDTRAGAYTNVDAGGTGLLYNGADASDYFRLGGAFDQADLRAVSLVGSAFPSNLGSFNEGNWAAVTNLGNQPLALSVGNGSAGNFTGGDPANTLKVTVLYTTIEV